MGKLLDVVMPWSFDEICGLSKAFNTSRENFLTIDIAFVLLILESSLKTRRGAPCLIAIQSYPYP